MWVTQAPSRVQPRTNERRVRVTQWLREVQEGLHWDSYFSRCPEAAALALPKVVEIINEELAQFEQRRRFAHPRLARRPNRAHAACS